MSVVIERASLFDINALAYLFDAYRVFYKQASDPVSAREFITARLNNRESEIFVARVDEELVGFVQLYPIFSSVQMKRCWLLNDLYVHPDHRGKRISVQLIDRAKQLSRDTHAAGLLLETAKTNTIGNALYPITGFTLDGDHNYYFWKG